MPIVPPGGASEKHIIGDRLVVGAKIAPNDVELERVVVERQGLCVASTQSTFTPPVDGLSSSCLEVLGREVPGDHIARYSLLDCHVPRARGHVEHPLARRDSGRLDDHRTDLVPTVAFAKRW